MQKLFTLVCAMLASFSIFATTYHETSVDAELGTRDSISEDYKTREWNLISPTAKAAGSNIKADKKTYNDIYFSGASITFKKGSSNGYLSCTNQGNVYIPVPAGAAGTIYMTPNGGSTEGRYFNLYLGNSNTLSTDTTQRLYSYYAATPTGKRGPQSFTFAATDTTMLDGKAYLHLQDNNTEMKVAGFKVVLTTGSYRECTDPEFTVSPTEGTGFVGDPIDITISTKNQSKPIKCAVTIDGEEGEIGTDYIYNASIGLVQATPLKAGTFEITFSQASNGTYCDAEESATFVISEKAPVTTFEVAGPTSARVGDEVTLTAKNFDAAATSIWWTDKYGQTLVSTAEYTFTPEAEGTIELTAWAENEFNTNPVTVAHNVTVTIGHNALLSDLKVNGATIDGFADDKFEYDLGEIGVYEPVKVEATPDDAPYATATVNPGNNNVLITVFAQDQTTYKSYVITYTRAAATTLASISGDATWDWANAGSATAEQKGSTLPSNADEFNFADVLISPAASFNAAALLGIAQFANRGTYFQGTQVKLNTTVAGTISVYYQNTSNREESGRRWVEVNGTKVGDGAIDQKNWYLAEANVSSGDVVITFIDKSDAATMLRINKIVFTKSPTTALDNTDDAVKATKRIVNGQLIIEKNGEVYNVLGARVR